MLHKHLFDIVDLDEGTKDRVPTGYVVSRGGNVRVIELTARDT